MSCQPTTLLLTEWIASYIFELLNLGIFRLEDIFTVIPVQYQKRLMPGAEAFMGRAISTGDSCQRFLTCTGSCTDLRGMIPGAFTSARDRACDNIDRAP